MSNLIKRGETGLRIPATTFGALVDNIFRDNLNRFFDDDFWGRDSVRNVGVPVNIKETDKSYEMEVVAPGLKKEDFQMDVSGDVLTVRFEHGQECQEGGEKEGWLRKEYQRQSFSRRFNVDDTVDTNKITAKYHDGILHVTLPKKDRAKKVSRTVTIQ